MTKASRVLTIVVTVFAVAFAGAAMINSATRTDWKYKSEKEFPAAAIQDQKKELDELKAESDSLDLQLAAWNKAVAADALALDARETRWNAELTTLAAADKKAMEDIETEKKKAQARLDELSLRREEISRLTAQYEELLAEKDAAQADVRRLRDLLVQAKGNLDRVERRQQILKNESTAGNN